MSEISVRSGSVANARDSAVDADDVFQRSRVRDVRESIIHAVLFLCAAVSILVTVGIIASLFTEGIAFFIRPEVSIWRFITGTEWKPLSNPVRPENFGVLPLINGTLMIGLLSGLIAVPLGLGSAIFLSEYAHANVRRYLKPALEVLAGIPTVVYGYFALSLITPLIRGAADGINNSLGTDIHVAFFNALSASIVVAVMIIPMIASISEDAMRAVPRSLREAAYGLGATKFEVATKVVVPAALSGILAAFIIAISRAIGETMAVTIAAGATPRMTLNPLDSVQTMTAFIVQVSFGDAAAGSINGQSIFAVGSTLFLMTLGMNFISNRVMRHFREVYE